MAQIIIRWSFEALNDRKNIYAYWEERNNSKKYSRKLDLLIIKLVKKLRDFPQIGRRTSNPFIRFLILREYQLFYYIDQGSIIILRIWDIRQDPDKIPYF